MRAGHVLENHPGTVSAETCKEKLKKVAELNKKAKRKSFKNYIVWCLTKLMLTTNMHFDTGTILAKMHCSRNSIIIGVVLK